MPVYKGSTLVNGVNVRIENTVSSGGITPAGTIDISSNGTYDVTEYASANVNVPASGIDTSDATATANDIAAGKTAYADSKKLEGSLADYQAGAEATFASNHTEVSDDSAINFLCRGLNQGAKILRDGSYAKVYVKKTEFGDASAADVAQGKTFTSSSGLKVTGTAKASAPTLQSKTATPSTSQQIITPDSGYDGLSQITVEAIPSGSLSTPTISSSGLITAQVGTSGYLASGTKVTKQLTTQAAKTVTPTASEQTVVNSAVYTTGAVKVAAVPTETKTITANGTYTPSSGKYLTQVTVNVPASGIDTSDATATANDIAEGVTAYVNGEKITGTIQKASTVYNLGLPEVQAEKVNDTRIRLGMTTLSGPIIVGRGVTVRVGIDSDKISNVLGDATPEDVASGKTFSAGGGFTMVGTATASTPSLQEKSVTPSATEQTVTPDSGYDGLSRVTVEAMPTAALSTPTISVDSAGKITAKVEQTASGYVEAGSKSATKQLTTKGAATITPGTSDQTIASGTYLTGAQTIKGDANLVAGNIKSGVSIFGVAGSFAGSGGGGSSDNNCEAYHITSASAKLNFKTTGTVKVWGYGTVTSGYSTSICAFVGDGYYKSASWGNPTKTSASFSINADGTLNGLPSGLQAVDLLVTIGV